MELSRDDSHLVVFWLVASIVATLLAMNYTSAALIDGQFIPAGNDSFYHARRILDAAIGERGFYQFDDTIHVPEGSWLTWPWGYDFLMALLLSIALAVMPNADPMAVLGHLPLLFLAINAALFTLLLRESGLSKPFIALALAVFAFAPTTQGLHGVGVVDHHFIELTFVLASAWLGLRFFTDTASVPRGVALGAVLGLAPAFHNSLFVLQVPVLLAAFACWLRGIALDARGTTALAASLPAVTLVALLPSAPFLAMHFEFATHSWFHLYVAVCSGIVLAVLGRSAYSTRLLALLVAGGVLLSIPLVLEMIKGARFLAGATAILGDIVEVRSPFALWRASGELSSVSRYYGLLVVLAPLLLAASAVALFRLRSGRELFLGAALFFGLLLLLTQFRLHPFGSWTLPVATLWFLQRLGERREWPSRSVTVAATVLLALSLQPAFAKQLFARMPVGLAEKYEYSRPIYLALGEVCAAAPGTVLAEPDDGHPIRFHSDCSVIANNFLLTRLHGEKALLAHALLDTPPAELAEKAPGIHYVLIRPTGLWRAGENGIEAVPRDEALAANPRLIRALSADTLPPGFELLGEIPINDGRGLAYARLLRVQ